jgi:signal transduction histidine kinase
LRTRGAARILGLVRASAIWRFFAAQWEAFASSHDPPDTAALVSPTALIAPILVAIGELVLGYVPALAALSHFRLPWLCAAIMLLAVAASVGVWRLGARGRLGTLCCLLDTFGYVTALSLPVALTTGPFATGFAIATGFFLIFFPARVYGFTLLLAIPMLVPPAVVMLALRVEPLPGVVLGAVCAFAFVLSVRTRQRRMLQQQNLRLRTALGAVDQVANASFEVALAAATLDLGHELHELRNSRAACAINLGYLRDCGGLAGEALKALQAAIAARQEEDRIIARMLDDLRRKTRPSESRFVVQEIVRQCASDVTDLEVIVADEAPRFEVDGNPEHLRLVLQNLARNADQAGARHLTLTLQPDMSGQHLLLVVADDGPGLPPEVVEVAFQPFVTARAGGTGLGLYLSRRNVEIMGGRIALDPTPHGGAAFRITLPGRMCAAVGGTEAHPDAAR